MSQSPKVVQKRKRSEEEKSENPSGPKKPDSKAPDSNVPKTKQDLTSRFVKLGEPVVVTYTEEVPPKELIGMAVGVLQKHDVLEVDAETGRMYLTPEKLPPTPSAPIKPEVFYPSPNTRFGADENPRKRVIDFDAAEGPGVVPDEDAHDEDNQMPPELDRIDTNTFDIGKAYNPEEPNYIARSARALLDGLIDDDVHHKQWYMEQALKALIGNGFIDDLRERLDDEFCTLWDLGSPPH